MSDVQRIIKYCSIAFAIFLIYTILSGLMGGILSIGNIFDNDDTIAEKLDGLDIEGNVSIINIDVASVDITVKTGDKLSAETNNKDIEVREENNKLFITEKKRNWYKNNNTDLVVYIPENMIFDGIAIESGAGKVNIDKVFTKKLYLELGAGKVNINYLNVEDEATIEGGAGNFILKDGVINDLDLDMGVGKLEIKSKLTGNNKIDAGVGTLDIDLIGSINDYKINVEKGIGSIKVDGNEMKDNSTIGNGFNKIDIDGGVGSMKVNFAS